MNGSVVIRLLGRVSLLAVLLLVVAWPAATKEETQSQGCHTYRVDEDSGRLYFNDPKAGYVVLPDKELRRKLKAEGKPGQVFAMRDCGLPNLEGDVTVYQEANESSQAEEIYSATRVVILAEQGEWIKIKGHTPVWQGVGWVKRGNKLLVVKF